MIVGVDPAAHPEMTAGEIKKSVMRTLYELVIFPAKFLELSRWDDGTLELQTICCGRIGRFFIRNGLVYDVTNADFNYEEEQEKTVIPNCIQSKYTACYPGCGCRCMIDFEYRNQTLENRLVTRHCGGEHAQEPDSD
jgi:hypothetical protein